MTSSGTTSRLATGILPSHYPITNREEDSAKPAKIGSTLLAVYIFLIASRILDLSGLWWLHIPLLLWLVLTFTTLVRGKLSFAFSSKATKYFAAFTVWVLMCLPFSKWRAASMTSLQWQIQSFIIFLIIVQTVKTTRDWQKIVGAFAYATTSGALLAFHYGYTLEGRLALPGGTLGDPNEFALLMVVGLPFWWFKMSRAQGVRKIFFLCCTLPVYLAFARSGSRAGLLAMAVLLFLSFIFARGTQKIIIPITVLVGVVAATFLLPGYIQTRFTTFFSPGSSSDAFTQSRISSDIASSEERKALLIQSIEMTLEHPIVGVGPGCFSFVAWDERKATSGSGGLTLVSHNTYTQISSETGLPGFFLFFTTVFLCVRSVLADYRRSILVHVELAQYARYLCISMGALAVGIFFLSVAYTHMTATIFGFAIALHNLVESSLKNTGSSTTPRVPAWQSPVVSNLKQRPYQANQLQPRKRAWPEAPRQHVRN